MNKNRITYWLYYNDEIITSVRGDLGMSENEIKRYAIESENKVPLHIGRFKTFDEFVNQVSYSIIKTYPMGN